MGLARKVAFNTVVQIGGRVLTTALSLVLIGSLTRYLGVTGFGTYTTIFAYTAFFAILADFGFFNILVRELSTGKNDDQKVVNNVITFRALFALLVYAVGFAAALFLNQYDQETKLGIGIIAIAQFWLTLNSTLVGVFQAKLRMDKAVLTDVAGRIVTLSLVLLLISWQMPLLWVIGAYTVGNFVNFFLSAVLARGYVRLRPVFDFPYWKFLIKITLPMGVLAIVSYVYFHIDMIILSLMKDEFDVGIYGASYKILEILLTLPAIFTGSIFPILTNFISARDNRSSKVFQEAFNFLLIAALPVAAGLFLLAKPLVTFVAGTEFVVASAPGLTFFGTTVTAPVVLQILTVALFLSFLSHLFSATVIALGKYNKLVLPNIILMLFNIVFNILLIPKYSYLAAALVTVVGEFFIVIFPLIIIAKSQISLPNFSILYKAVISTAVMAAAILMLSNLPLIPLVLIAAAVYLSVLYLIGGIPKEMIAQIISPKTAER